MKYKITYEDGITFTSPDIRSRNPGWASEDRAIPGGIKRLQVLLPSSKSLILEGYERYNFFVEASQHFRSDKAQIKAFFFCGSWHGYVVVYRIDIVTGQITKRLAQDGQEYYGTATRGWKQGLIGDKARSGII